MELGLLLDVLGVEVAGRVVPRRNAPDPALFLGSGKVDEVAAFAKEVGASLLVVDAFLSPTQLSLLRRRTGLEIWDRAFVIMKVFQRGAKTAEAKLQVELAQCRYEIPYLKGLGHQMSRPGGGIGTRGPGETEFERHRRKLERRVLSIEKKLEEVRSRREKIRERRRRAGLRTVALVGYTNSGKSTLLKRLSKDESLYEANQLFSTLDTSSRRVRLPSGSFVLMSDTVGFIRKLPPTLVAAFRATLEEVCQSDLLLILLDASDVDPMERLRVVNGVLADIGAEELPRLIALNKKDLVGEEIGSLETILKAQGYPVCSISALSGEGMDEMLVLVERLLEESGGR